MTNEQIIKDLKVLRDYFKAENDGCAPACLDYAIKALEGNTQEAEWCDRSFMSSGNILRTRSDVVEYKCSKCHRWTQWWYGTDKNEYCSHCGSKMTNTSNTIKDYERSKFMIKSAGGTIYGK